MNFNAQNTDKDICPLYNIFSGRRLKMTQRHEYLNTLISFKDKERDTKALQDFKKT